MPIFACYAAEDGESQDCICACQLIEREDLSILVKAKLAPKGTAKLQGER